MRDFLRGVKLMLTVSWRADRLRSVLAGITASGQYIVLPLRALGLKVLTDGVVAHDSAHAVAGAAMIVGFSAANRLMAWASLNVRMRLREHTQLYLDTHLMGLTAGIPGIAHHELPEYLDSVERLRMERPYLANPFNPISWTTASILQAGTVVVLLVGISPLLALLPLFGIPAAIASAHAEERSIDLVDEQAEQSRVLRHLMDLTTQPEPAKELRIYGLADELLERRVRLFDALEAEHTRQSVGNVARISSGWVLFAAAYGAALWWTVDAAQSGTESIGAVVLVLTLGAQLNSQLADLAYNVAWFARSLRAVRRLVWFTQYADDATATIAASGNAPPPSRLDDGIRFEHVGFSYPGSGRRVLEDVNLFLPAGSTIAIVGENGSGKTTLVKLLARMYEPTTGRILVDDVDVATMDIEAWRRRMSAGFQDFERLHVLARHSVGAGDVTRDATDDVVHDALRRAVAADLPNQFPDRLDTQLGRQFDGIDLSVGQWQKVALGRAMMRDTPLLLVLDEPTASLDAPTEHALFEQFAGAARDVARTTGGITVLVSHRFSTVRMADLIVVLSHGEIVETGPHDELMRANGAYAQLYRIQARAYRVD
ncbi:MAG TPA: ABC transporter ATP-binding protein [Acidimicrobiales bacterium]|nr:ABC transporter ATP-binding protein [Acidimicrobiales bacterium]